MLLVGLTGGIASGKTLVSRAFNDLGVPVIDADVLARCVVEPGSTGLQALVDRYGKSLLKSDGSLDRAALRRIVFRNDDDRIAVEAILHPRIHGLAKQYIEQARLERHAYCIYVVPLLVETAQQAQFDVIVVVDSPVDLQIERLMLRDQCTREAALQIINTQADRQARLEVADYVLENDGDAATLIGAVKRLHRTLTDRAI